MVLCQKWAGQGKQNSTLKEIGETWTRMPRLDQGLSWLERWGQHLHWSDASSGSAWSLEYASHLSKTTLTSPGHVALHDVPVERPGCLLVGVRIFLQQMPEHLLCIIHHRMPGEACRPCLPIQIAPWGQLPLSAAQELLCPLQQGEWVLCTWLKNGLDGKNPAPEGGWKGQWWEEWTILQTTGILCETLSKSETLSHSCPERSLFPKSV